jgi:UPF0042 nucleotide-binding protein
MRLIVVSGLSGAGKSVALRLLEDEGWFCIDNLPAALIEATVFQLEADGNLRVALGIDARSAKDLHGLLQSLRDLTASCDLTRLFLDADDDILLRRFSETRRRHPLSQGDADLLQCIAQERALLADLAGDALRMDTSHLTANALRDALKQILNLPAGQMTLVLESFGFKRGLPLDADLLFDVRCLPNPHYQVELRALSGCDVAVADFLAAEPLVQAMLSDIRQHLTRWLPQYLRDNWHYFTVAIGCTGGRHRSVWFAEQLAESFRDRWQVLVRHRDLD